MKLDFRKTDVTAKLRVTYFKGKFLEVRFPPPPPFSSMSMTGINERKVALHHEKWDEWTTCFSVQNLDLPLNPFLGFSAHTGDVHGQFSPPPLSPSGCLE